MREKRYTLLRAMDAAEVKSASSFARTLGINQSTVSGWINGSINPSFEQAKKVAAALDWKGPIEELFLMGGK